MGMGLGYDDKMFLKVFNSRAVNGKERQMYVFSGSQPRYVRWQCIVKDVFGVGIGQKFKTKLYRRHKIKTRRKAYLVGKHLRTTIQSI